MTGASRDNQNDEPRMSSFSFEATEKSTGKVRIVWAIDDYFGRHKYGYVLRGEDHHQVASDEEVLNEKDFYNRFETKEAK